MADKFQDEVLTEEQLDKVNGGLVTKELIEGALNIIREIKTTIDSDEYSMLSDKQKNMAFVMALEGNTAISALSMVPGIGDAISALNKMAAGVSSDVRMTAENALDVILKLGEKYNAMNPT